MTNRKMNINMFSIKSLYLEVYYNGIKLSTATGFTIEKDSVIYLVTNRHVVTGRHNETGECLDKDLSIPNKLYVWFPYKEGNSYIWSKIKIDLYDEEDKKLWMEHPLYKDKVDVVAIKMGLYNQNIFSYGLESKYEPIVTEQLYIVGYPFGISPKDGKYAIWTTGIVASDPDLNLCINDEQLPCFLVDAKTRSGQSGSPVIYYSSNGMQRENNGFAIYGGPVMHEIGIYSGRIKEKSDLGYVWKWTLIKEII